MERKAGVDSKRSVLSDSFSAQERRTVIVNVSENFEMPGMSRKGRGRASRIGALSAAGSKSSGGPLGRKARGPGAVVGDSDSRSSTPVSVASASRNSARLAASGKIRTTPGVPRKKGRRFMEDVVDDEDEDLAMDVDFHDAEDSRTNSEADDDEVNDELDDSFDETGSVWSEASDSTSVSLSSKLKLLPRRPKSPEFDDDEEIPALQPPESSTDLFIEGQNLMEAVGIYEVLRHFSANVRLSPFRFEEFCAALCTDEQSTLLAEMHIMLLRALLREDDGNNTLFGPQDVKDSINIQLFMIDPMTWYENVRAYLDSDPSPEFTLSLPAMEKTSYSSLTIGERLQILGTLTNLFLATNPVREGIFTSEGNARYDDICRSCHRVGDLLCCDTCSAVYHLPCLDLPEVPEDEWICGVCRLHQVKGVYDCMSEAEKGGLLCRQEPIGYDRHRRKYWFLCRRIIVEGEDDVRYYSTPLQLEELLETLDTEKYEKDLVTSLVEMKDEITRQMMVTEELTKENQGSRKSALEITNANLLKLQSERAAKMEEENQKKQEEENAVEASTDSSESKKEDRDESDIHMEVEEIKDEFSHVSTMTSETVSSQSVTSMNESTTVKVEPKKEVVEVKEVTTVVTSVTTTVTSTTVTQNTLDAEKLKTGSEAVKVETKDVEVKPDEIKSKIETLGSRMAPKTMVVITKDGGKLLVPLPRPNTNGADTTVVTESSSQESTSSTSVTSEGRRIVTRSKTGSLTPKQFADSITIALTTAKTTSKDEGIMSRDGDGVRLTRSRTAMSASAFLLSQSIYFKLGAEGSFKLYQNQYSTNPLALSKNQHNEEREKKRHLSHKFSLTPVSEFTWNGSTFGSSSILLGTLRQNILQLETNFPAPLLHPNWPQHRARWTKLVNAAIRPEDFANVLGMLESGMKPVLFNQVWHEALGHSRLRRTPVLDRDEVKKRDRELRRRKDEEEEPGKNTWVKYTLGIRHTVWKQKGEEYRVVGQGGWIWTSSTRTTRFVPAASYGLRALAAKLQARKQKALEKRKAAEEGKALDQEDGKGEDVEGKKENGRKEGFLNEKSGLMVMEEDSEEAKEPDVEEDVVPEIKQVIENFDISKALINRTHYARITKPYSRLEHLLDRRLKQAELEQKQKTLFEQLIQHYRSEERKKAKQTEETICNNVGITAEVALPPAKTAASSGSGTTGVGKYQCYSATCRGGGHDSKSCYSVLCCELGVRSSTRQNLVDALPNLDLTNGDLDEAGSEEDGSNNNEVSLENEDKEDGLTGQLNNCEDSSDSTKLKNRILNETEKQILAKSLKHDTKDQSKKAEGHPVTSELTGKPSVLASDGDIALVSLSSFLQNGKLQLTPDLITQLEVRLARMGKTELPVHLTKRGPGRPAKSAPGTKAAGLLKKGAIPSVHRFLTPSKKSSLFVLRRHFLHSLARHEGKRETTGFNYACKMNNVNWPYPCPRPYFKTAWEYRTQTMQNLPAVAVQLRILWACLRWDDLAAKPPTSGTNTVTTETDITTTKILKRRDVGPYGLRSEFLVRKIVIPISVPSQPREKYTPQRSGLRERRRPESPKHKEPSVTEAWLPEEQLDLWEIKLFGDRIEKQNLMALEKKAQQQKQAEAQKSTTDTKSQIEEQLKLRQTTGLKRTADGQLKTPDTSAKPSVVRIIQNPTPGGVGVKTLPFSTTTLIPSTVGSGIHTIQIQQPNRSLLMNTSSLLAPAAVSTPTQNVQSLRIIQGPNGQLQVQGLLPGQQILRLPDGRLHLIPGAARPVTQQQVVVQAKTSSSLPLSQAPQSGSEASTGEAPSSTNLMLTGTNIMTGQVEPSAASSTNATTQRYVLTGGSLLSQSTAGAKPTQVLPKVVMAASGSLALAGQRQHMLVTSPKVVKLPLSQQQQPLASQPQQTTRVMLPSGQMISGQSTVLRTASGQHFIIHSGVPTTPQQKPLVPSNVVDAGSVGGSGTAPVVTDSPASLTTCLSLSTSPSGMSPTKYTLTPQVLQQASTSRKQERKSRGDDRVPEMRVVSQALMQTQDPDIQAKLLAMQKVMQQQQQLTPPSSASSSDANAAATPQQQHSHLLQVKQQQQSIQVQVPGASTAALATTPVKKGLTQEQKEEQARLAACNHVIKNLLDSVDKQERHELKRQRKQETSDEKSKRLQHQKLDAQVTKRKEALKREILKKRNNLEKTITAKLQAEVAKAVDARQPRKVVHTKRPRTEPTPKADPTPPMPAMSVLAPDSIVSTPPVACELEVKEPKAKRRKNRSTASSRAANVKTEASDDQLYCLCKTPYDESKFYIGCDRCEGWFHGSCVGVTKSEADHIDSYVCPLCRAASGDNAMNQTRLQDHHQVELRKLINNVKTHRMSWPFREPVNPKEVPDYYAIIKEPMDLSTVESNLVSHRYTTLGEFVKDVTKIFDNCRYYNPSSSQFYRCAETLEVYFVDKLKALKEKLKI